jgi:solute carrier family 9B (sodium/hydrogen exchanger), member 1/2
LSFARAGGSIEAFFVFSGGGNPVLTSSLLILIIGLFAGQAARRLNLPPLIGMILAGILIGPQFADLIGVSMLDAADSLRTVAVMIILVKAGLGLDREKLKQQGSVALRLGILPAICEVFVIALAAILLFNFDLLTGLLLGFILGAESPAVIVPAMLRLKSLGLGVTKGIPDAILSGSALSDVLMILGFTLVLNLVSDGAIQSLSLFGGFVTLPPFLWIPLQLMIQIGLGIAIGFLAARLLVLLLAKEQWTTSAVQDGIVAAGLALALVLAAQVYPIFSGYLAAMALGFFLIEVDAPLARYLRGEFDRLWLVAEIFLFVLLGATVELDVLGNVLLPGLLLLAVGLLVGRMIGWILSTMGSNWNWRERLFLLPGNMPKATVQAALGALPLAYGIAGGEIILAVATLSILVTAPIGAWATPLLAPRLLEKGEVDPTRVAVTGRPLFLAAVDTSPLARDVLIKTADFARRSHGEALVLHVDNKGNAAAIEALREQTESLLADIRYKFMICNGSAPEEIVRVSQEQPVTALIIGQRGRQRLQDVLLGSVSGAVLDASTVPVIVVEEAPVSG